MVCGRVEQSTHIVQRGRIADKSVTGSENNRRGSLVICVTSRCGKALVRSRHNMGEDRVAFAEKNGDVLSSRQRHSSVISSCSEDAETESTSTGYHQEDEEKEEELEYGPGIVNKLKTRFLSITLKQNRGTNMRRSCSMENLLDQDRPCRNAMFSSTKFNANGGEAGGNVKNPVWGNLKRAKSMDTLLMDLKPEPPSPGIEPEMNGDSRKEPKIVRRRDAGLLRTGPIICDEELPKPDTVKTYKRMFEPAESRRGSYSRRPPVLRASARSGSLLVSKTNGVTSSAKVNGTVLKSKLCAKQSPVKAQSDAEIITYKNCDKSQSLPNIEDSKSVCNGGYVKAVPVKITDNSLCNGKIEKCVEKKMNDLNITKNKKDSQQNGEICNGNSIHKELIAETFEEYIKPDVKKLAFKGNKFVNGGEIPVKNIANGIKTKPKVPPNRPTFIKNVRPGMKIPEQGSVEKKNFTQKQKSNISVSAKKAPEIVAKSEIRKIEIPTTNEKELNGDVRKDCQEQQHPAVKDNKTVEENNRKNIEKVPPEVQKVPQTEAVVSAKKPETEEVNGDAADTDRLTNCIPKSSTSETKPVKKQSSEAITTSMVFDFRGKDVVPHVAVLPTPFGCKAVHPKRRPVLIDGKEGLNGSVVASDDDEEYHMDYSVPPPCGVTFEGENVKIGKGAILSTRNKDLKIKFDDNVDENTFVYPSESSFLEDGEHQPVPPASTPSEATIPNGPSKLKTNPAIGSSNTGGLSTYTPSVLRTVDNFEPGMFRPLPAPPGKEEHRTSGEEENTEVRKEEEENKEAEMLKPADPGIISSWSLSAGTSDLLF